MYIDLSHWKIFFCHSLTINLPFGTWYLSNQKHNIVVLVVSFKNDCRLTIQTGDQYKPRLRLDFLNLL